MLIPMGFLGGGASTSFDLLATTVLAASSASVVFNLTAAQQSSYKHLQLRVVARGSNAQQYDTLAIQFNGDSATNYAYHYLNGASSAASSGNALTQSSLYAFRIAGSTATTGAYAGGIMDILDAFSTTKAKVIRSFSGEIDTSYNQVILASGWWNNTAAISSLTLSTGSILAGSRFSLYGVKG